jgi:D-3-phosphoglycerate dehydrogenase / 2-oxoglutarate reductase
MNILVTDFAWKDLGIERQILSSLDATLVVAKSGDEDELAHLAAEVEGVFTNWKRVSREVIAKAPRCKAIIRYGVGLDNIDVHFATECGIVVANVPDYCIEEVSDHALALLLAMARKVTIFDRATKNGIYELSLGTPFYRLRGKTLGLVGFGKIGKIVARKAFGLGLKVIAFSRSGKQAHVGTDTVEAVSFSELLHRSDYISLHVPLTPDTRHLFNLEAFRQMKPTAFLVNTARGDVVDSQALLAALNDNLIAGAALDVLPKEPPDADDPLLRHSKTIVTPHAAFNSEESLEELRTTAASQMRDILQGKKPEFFVNPAVLENPGLRASLK